MDRAHVSIYSLTGSLIYEDIHYQPGQWIDLDDQPAGSYLLRVVTEGSNGSKLIQKQ
jgi:hypothetical protein